VESLAKDLKVLIGFIKRFNFGQTLIISSNIERIEKIEGLKLIGIFYK